VSESAGVAPAGEEGPGRAAQPRISYVIARLDRALRRRIADRVRLHGLTVPQYTALSVLGRRGGLSNAQLARRAYITPQSMSEVLEALVAKGLVERGPHPNHRRVLPAMLTTEGERALAACDAAVSELEEEMLRDLGPDERDLLRTAMISCVRALHAGFPEPHL
jgi:DNA-binding MarR family transcriptional regulator